MDTHSDAGTTAEIRFPEPAFDRPPGRQAAGVPRRFHRDRVFPAPNLSIISKQAWISIVAVTMLPFFVVVLVAIHPWTFSSDGQSSIGSGQPDFERNGQVLQDGNADVTTAAQAATDTVTVTGTTPDTTDGVTSSAGSGDPAGEAATVTGLLQQAKTVRQSVVSAVQDASNCGDLSSDQQTLASAASQRTTLASTASDTPVDALSGASDVPGELSQALSDSATADQDFVAWINDLESSCSSATATNDSQYQQAESESRQATQDKQNFLATWNPIASRYGQPTFAESDI